MSPMMTGKNDIQSQARALAVAEIGPRAAEVDRTEEYPWDNVKALTEAGFMGMTIPIEYGGRGLDFLDAAIVIEEMAKVCGVTGRIVVEANMGAISAIMRYGNEAQKQLASELVLAGDKPAICITEPDAGSAATSMTTRADQVDGGYKINGKKHWITGGGVSKLHLIFARVFNKQGEEQGIGGFITTRGTDGLVISTREPAMGLRGIPETQVLFEDLMIPDDMVLMPPSGFKRGFGDLMTAYNSQRVGAATVALGVAQGAYEQTLSFVKTREQFGRPIAEFQGLQWMLADMSTQLSAARALVHGAALSAATSGNGFPDALQAAEAKLFTSEMAVTVTNNALQMHGAAGYSRNNPLERMVRDARMFTIGGGTAQVLRTMIASRILDAKLPQTRDGYTKLAARNDAK